MASIDDLDDEGPDVSGCGDPNCLGGCGFAPGEAGGHPPQIINPKEHEG